MSAICVNVKPILGTGCLYKTCSKFHRSAMQNIFYFCHLFCISRFFETAFFVSLRKIMMNEKGRVTN